MNKLFLFFAIVAAMSTAHGQVTVGNGGNGSFIIQVSSSKTSTTITYPGISTADDVLVTTSAKRDLWAVVEGHNEVYLIDPQFKSALQRKGIGRPFIDVASGQYFLAGRRLGILPITKNPGVALVIELSELKVADVREGVTATAYWESTLDGKLTSEMIQKRASKESGPVLFYKYFKVLGSELYPSGERNENGEWTSFNDNTVSAWVFPGIYKVTYRDSDGRETSQSGIRVE